VTTAVITAKELAKLLGVDPWTVYEATRRGDPPVEPIHVGRRLVWSKFAVADLLGVDVARLDDMLDRATDDQ
jgi:predicted DNA-binding transcriptional regulator AlpA